MAESKNTFIKSKMNQDLDSRLVPNGEYREAFNISISQSEGADVGTLQTVLGNVENIDFSSDDYCNAKINGILSAQGCTNSSRDTQCSVLVTRCCIFVQVRMSSSIEHRISSIA